MSSKKKQPGRQPLGGSPDATAAASAGIQPGHAHVKEEDDQMTGTASSSGTKRPLLTRAPSRGLLAAARPGAAGPIIASMSLTTPKKKVARVTKDEVDDDGVTLMSDSAVLDADEVEVQECSGCFRTNNMHFSFTVPFGLVEFQYTSRHCSFCRDCHTIWRLCYKSRLTLVLLQRYLVDWDRRLQFIKELVALLVLRFENCSRATASMICAKVDSLNFVFELINVPWPYFCVQDPAEVDLQKLVPAAINFVESRVGGQSRLMCLSTSPPPVQKTAQSGTQLLLLADHQQRLRATVTTNRPEDVEWWRQHIAKDDQDQASKGKNDDEDGNEDDTQDSGSVPENISVSATKAMLAVELTTICLDDLRSDRWADGTMKERLKERTIGKQLTKALKLQHEIASGPEAAVWMDSVGRCVDALSSAKKMFPALMSYIRTFSPQKLSAVHSTSGSLRKFFTAESLEFGPKLRRIFWKAEFEGACDNDRCDAAIRMLSDDADLQKMHGGDIAARMLFVLDSIINVVSNFLTSPSIADKTNEAVRDEMTRIVTKFQGAVHRLDGGTGSVLDDALGYALTILEASTPETKVVPGQLIAAKTRLQSDDAMKKMWHMWFNSSAGTVLVADADMLLVASALDAECLNDLMLGIKALEEPGVPRRSDDGMLVGAASILDDQVLLNLFGDASKQISMAMKTWSPVGVDENMEKIRTTTEHMADITMFIDTICSWALTSRLGSSLKAWSIEFEAKADDMPLPLISEDMDESAQSMEIMDNAEELAALESAKLALAGIQRLRGISRTMDSVIDRFNTAVKNLEHNIKVRTFIIQELSDILQLLRNARDSMPLAYKDLLAEYMREDSKTSTLGTVIAMRERRVFRSAECSPLSFMDDLQIAVQTTDGVVDHIDTTTVSGDFANMLDNKVSVYFIRRFLLNNLTTSLHESWKDMDFMSKSHMAAAGDEKAAGTLESLLRSALPAAAEEKLVQAIGGSIGESTDFGTVWMQTAFAQKHSVCIVLLRFSRIAEVSMPDFFDGSLEMTILMDLLSLVFQVFSALAAAAWVRCKYLSKSNGCIYITDTANAALPKVILDPMLMSAFNYMRDGVADLHKNRERLMKVVDAVDGVRFTTVRFENCMAALDNFEKAATSVIVSRFAAAVDDFSSQCESVCPRWSHIFTGDAYKPALAKRQILNAPGRHKLPAAASKLESVINPAALYRWLGPSDKVDPNGTLAEAVTVGESTLEMAWATLAVAAAVNILEDFGCTPKGIEMAKEFMKTARPKGFPKALEVKVEELAKK